MNIHARRQALLDAILSADIAGARAISQAHEAGGDALKTVTDLIEPVLETVGQRWEAEQVSLAQGFVAAKVAEDVFERAANLSLDSRPAERGPVVIGNIEDDFHALGRRMVVAFLRAGGWSVEDLGNDVPAADLVDKAVAVNARVIAVSAMTMTSARNVRKVREEIDGRGLSGALQLAVGGAVFNLRPNLVAEVGGDGTCRNALGAPALMERLWRASLESAG